MSRTNWYSLTNSPSLLLTLIPVSIAAGLHVFSWVADELPKQCLVRNPHRHGLIIGGIEDYLLVPDPQG